MSLRDAEVGHGPNCTDLEASAQHGDLVCRADAAPAAFKDLSTCRAQRGAEAVSELLRKQSLRSSAGTLLEHLF